MLAAVINSRAIIGQQIARADSLSQRLGDFRLALETRLKDGLAAVDIANSREAAHIELLRLMRVERAFMSLEHVNRSGETIASAYRYQLDNRQGKAVQHREFPEFTRNNNFQLSIGALETERFGSLVAPFFIQDNQARTGNSIRGFLSLSRISEVLADFGFVDASTSMYLVDKTNHVLAHQFVSIAISRPEPKQLSPVFPWLTRLLLPGSESQVWVGRETSGRLLLVSVVGVPNTEWRVVFESPLSKALGGLTVWVSLSLLLLLLTGLSAWGISQNTARTLSAPIIQLNASATALAAINGEKPKQPVAADELISLAQTYHALSSTLQNLYATLEQRISDKTEELNQQFTLRAEQEQKIAILEERTRIMRDIHDGVGTHLVGLVAASKTETIDVKFIETIAQQALLDFRIAIDSLAPVEGDFTTVLATLRYRLSKPLESMGIKSVWEIGDIPEFSDERRSSVFNLQRIVSEAVTNAIKHAQATQIKVTANWDAATHCLILEVSDNGKGLDQHELTPGVGLLSMQRRAQEMGGSLIASNRLDERGTTVRLVLPEKPAASPV
jgi:signal transduction histidine kinase